MRALRYLDKISYLGLKIGSIKIDIKELEIRKKYLISELTKLEVSINKFKYSLG
jgi:hypothetical protein